MALGFKIKKFWVDLTGKCTAEGGFVGDVTGDLIGDMTGKTNLSPVHVSTSSSLITDNPSLVILDAENAAVTPEIANPPSTNVLICFTCADATNTCSIDLGVGGTATFTASGQGIIAVWGASSPYRRWYIVGNNGATIS